MDRQKRWFFRSGIARPVALASIGAVAAAAAACNALVGLDDLEHVVPDSPGACSNPAADCPAPAGPCQVPVCSEAGACAVASAPVKAPCSEGGGVMCSAAGECVGCVEDGDCEAPLSCGGGGVPGACGCEAPCHVWSELFQGSNKMVDSVYASTLAVHRGSGVAVVSGWFDGELGLGKNTLTGAGGQDAFVAKLDPSGGVLWSWSLGDPVEQLGFAAAPTDDGGVLATGSFRGTVSFGSEMKSSMNRDPYVARFGADGGLQWYRTSEGETVSAEQFGVRVVLDAEGNSIVLGHFAGELNFGTPLKGAEPMEMNALDIFLAKFGPGGDHLWTKVFGDTKMQRGPGLALDSAGNIYLAGVSSGTLSFSPGTESCKLTDIAGVGEDIYVAKLNSLGECVWAKNFGNNQTQYVQTVQVNKDQSVVVVGDFVGLVDFGNGPINSYGDRDAFVLKLDEKGDLEWIKRYGDALAQGGQAAVFDESGDIIVTGRFSGNVDFGLGAIKTESGLDSVFLLKLDAAGNTVWSRGFGKTGVNHSRGLALDGDGNAWLMGTTTGSIDFGGGLLVSSALTSMFLAKFKL
jgi:hypothetical protein